MATFFQIVQWVLLGVILLALLCYAIWGMGHVQRWYMLHDIGKYVLIAVFFYFFRPFLTLALPSLSASASANATESKEQPSFISRAIASLPINEGGTMNDVGATIRGLRVATNPSASSSASSSPSLLSCFLLTDLILGSIAAMFLFYQFLDPYFHPPIL